MRFRLGVAPRVALWFALLVSGCSEAAGTLDASGAAAVAVTEIPSVEEAYALPDDDLNEAFAAAKRRLLEERGTVQEVAVARRAAALAGLLARRESDAAWLDEARRILRAASSLGAAVGACEAALDLARLEARAAGDLPVAQALAARAAREYAEVADAAGCVAEAHRIAAILQASAAVVRVEGGSASAAIGGVAGPARLEAIVIHGEVPEAASTTVIRSVIRFDRVALFERGEAAADGPAPRRLYLDFEGLRVAPDVPEALSVGRAGLRRIRRGAPRQGVTRIVFELEDAARYRVFFLTEPYRVVVDVERAGVAEASAVASGARRPVRTIVLDPGHGGDDFGARFAGVRESDLVLDISRRAALLLERSLPGTRILLTRQRDRLIELEERTAMANAVAADLFVSVHLNAADDPVDRGGVTTFVLDTSNTRQALRLAARENGTSTREVTGLQRILADLHREGQLRESRRLAESVHRSTLQAGRGVLRGLPDRGVRSAMFYVLVGARMPAILLEASFLTKPEEAEALKTPRYRQALAAGIAQGIVRYARGD